jgi:putative phosphoesterase
VRIVVCSDSHNNFHKLHQMAEQRKDAHLFLHLGDGEREFEDLACLYPQKRFLSVRGNCDWASVAKSEDVVILNDKRIFFTHGHLYGVKRNTDRLLERAVELKADICCFGHTHTPLSLYRDGVYLLNPGSLSQPRVGFPSYAVIDLTQAGVAIHHTTLR